MKFFDPIINVLKLFKWPRSDVEQDRLNKLDSNLTKIDQHDPKKDLFDSVRDTYLDIAQSDPETALEMLKNELDSNPESELQNALIEIEKHIRQSYSDEYFGGMRQKKNQ